MSSQERGGGVSKPASQYLARRTEGQWRLETLKTGAQVWKFKNWELRSGRFILRRHNQTPTWRPDYFSHSLDLTNSDNAGGGGASGGEMCHGR